VRDGRQLEQVVVADAALDQQQQVVVLVTAVFSSMEGARYPSIPTMGLMPAALQAL